MKHLMLGESEELIKKAFGLSEVKEVKTDKKKVENIRKKLELEVKKMLKEKKYA